MKQLITGTRSLILLEDKDDDEQPFLSFLIRVAGLTGHNKIADLLSLFRS